MINYFDIVRDVKFVREMREMTAGGMTVGEMIAGAMIVGEMTARDDCGCWRAGCYIVANGCYTLSRFQGVSLIRLTGTPYHVVFADAVLV